MTTKKIVLLIVDGPSDEQAIGPLLKKLIIDKKIKFKVVGDMPGDYAEITLSNIERKLAKRVKNFLGGVFRVSDLHEIVHIIDTDGTYIKDSKVTYKDAGSIKYNNHTIETKHVAKIIKRNKLKSSVLDHLASLDSLEIKAGKKVPYRVYFMACNLDHVLHDKRKVRDSMKIDKALKFSDSYYGREIEFIVFMNSAEVLVPSNYLETWGSIKVDNRSLLRGSNFAIYLNKLGEGN